MTNWNNQPKAGTNTLTWDGSTFPWDAGTEETWDNASIPFQNLAKSTLSSWANVIKDSSALSTLTKHSSAWGNATKDASTFANTTKN